MKKSQLKEFIREIINEELASESQASDDAKRQGLEYLGFGRYGKDGKMTHRAVGGRLQAVTPKATPVSAGGKVPPSDTTKTKTSAPASDSGDRFGRDTNYLQVRKGATSAERKLVGKVSDMFNKVADTPGFYQKHANQSYSAAEFEKMTGIPQKAAKAFSKVVQDYESPFSYDEQSDTVDIHDPMDV